ncbi:hypothetical protein ACWF82_01605 [Nocardia sp. NPDC055053]
MNRVLSKTIATAAITLAFGAFPTIAAASPTETPPTTQPVVGGAPTPPFDPICPLCFIREALESLSAK